MCYARCSCNFVLTLVLQGRQISSPALQVRKERLKEVKQIVQIILLGGIELHSNPIGLASEPKVFAPGSGWPEEGLDVSVLF